MNSPGYAFWESRSALAQLKQNCLRKDNKVSTKSQGSQRSAKEAFVWRLWIWAHAQSMIYRAGTLIATRLRGLMPKRLGPGTEARTAPKIAARSLHELAKKKVFGHE
ncbi:lactate utilisation protein LutB domain-containing protein [Candidatus Vondammii sp. HM_W22]|uniref:lactate utilisation protein LutB domain-containing protein n=1 Tax=Candidatus Vondammii sp. HM_W22 TaxID=2687299 RepID=UPI001F12BB2B|nr:lactate utilisation protein LutB domain-containing protein [Candidatus Vondammii sp. HM_W22]